MNTPAHPLCTIAAAYLLTSKLSSFSKARCLVLFVAKLAVTMMAAAAILLSSPVAQSQGNQDETFILNLKNVEIRSLIETVSIRTGRNFIVDPRVKATVNVISSEPINAEKLYQVFLSVLEVHGYATVQAGQFTKVVPATVGVQSAVPLLGESSGNGDELVTQVLHLQSVPAQQMVEALRPMLPQSASISAESNTNAIIVTDRTANVKKLIKLIKSMDSQ